jgi:hypothetical protein
MRHHTLYWPRHQRGKAQRGQPGRDTCCGGAQAVAGKRVSTCVEQLETQSYTIPVTQPSIVLHASVRYPMAADNEASLGSSAR